MKKLTKFFALLGVLLFFGANSAFADTWVKFPGDHNNNEWRNDGVQPNGKGIAFTDITMGQDYQNFYFWISVYDGSDKNYSNGGVADLGDWVDVRVNSNAQNNKMSIPNVKQGERYRIEWNTNTNQMKITNMTAYAWIIKGTEDNWKEHYFGGNGDELTVHVDALKEFVVLNKVNDRTFKHGNYITVNVPGVGLSSSNGNNIILSKYVYDATVTIKTNGMDCTHITVDGKTSGWALAGAFYGNDWENQWFTQDPNNPNIYTLLVKPSSTSGKFQLRKVDNNNTSYYKVAPNTHLMDLSYPTLNFKNNNSEDAWIDNLKTDKTYLFTYNASTGDLTLSYPKEIYIYGHVNNRFWEIDNYVVLEQSATRPGFYTATNVDFSGFWGVADVMDYPNKERSKYDSTEDENYISFFDHLVMSMSDQGYKYRPKIQSSNSSYKDGDNNLEINVDKHKTVSGNTIYQQEPIEYSDQNLGTQNFMVAEAIYDVEFDLVNMTAKFIKKDKKDITYIWFSGEDIYSASGKTKLESAQRLSNQDKHFFLSNEVEYLQVGIEKNTEHVAALQAEYQVWYKPLTASPGVTEGPSSDDNDMGANNGPSYAKRRVYTDVLTNAGYTKIGDTGNSMNQSDLFDTKGSSSDEDNHLVMLNEDGYYALVAYINPDATGMKLYNDPEPNLLYVTVANNDPTGVDKIETEADGEAVYYNLQGVKVNNPDHGIYVKVVGGKASKVVL